MLSAFTPFQPAYLCVAAVFVAASHKVRLRPTQRGILLVTIGRIVAAVGLGLGPHVVKSGLTITSVASVVTMVGGIVIVALGARSMLRDRHRVGKLPGVPRR